jgi:GTPase SAR1 family protein/tetratricopeptide (TPR) repeat protein
VNGPAAAQAPYISRAEEDAIKARLSVVQEDRQSRVVLLYGPGGVGKTSLVRQMAQEHSDDSTIWLDPIDVDDPKTWLLSDLERLVTDRLDPGNAYFAEYRQQLSQLPNPARADISHETILSYLGRVKEVFARCYENYVAAGRKTVVITFDTVETIRGTNLLLTLTRWMRALPTGTLFILSGRPLASENGREPDTIETELEIPYQGLEVSTIEVGGFTRAGVRQYIRDSGISQDLTEEEEDKLVLLSRGHPLWLTFMIDYLKQRGVPPEASPRHTVDYLEQHLPYGEEMTSVGRQLHEEFLRQLVAPYKEVDFWPETIKRLAIVRQPVAREVWQLLMADYRLPSGISAGDEDWQAAMDDAWRELKNIPWIRPRANDQYVTLHDAVAEEFAKRLFPLHDQDQQWRHGIWRRALDIYRGLAAAAEDDLTPRLAELDAELRRFDSSRLPGSDPGTARLDAALIERTAELDITKRELDQLKAAGLYYRFLTDKERGCTELLDYFGEAERQRDSFFQDLLVLYLERFLPGGSHPEAFNDVIRPKLEEFRSWLNTSRPDLYIDLSILVARYLIDASQSADALNFLTRLSPAAASVQQRHDLYILKGNACLRVRGQAREALEHFNDAVAHAEAQHSADRHKLIAQAYKERGFYYRNTGQWAEADLSYQHAWETMVRAMSADSPPADRNELASIQTNWAYVKGLSGSDRDGLELVETALSIRRQLKRPADEGMSYSVYGEVYRYARRFEKAWAAYAEAERLLQGRRYWSRMGFVYQEQAICLFQAEHDGIEMIPNQLDEARTRITRALDICLTQLIRGYPSALNRAGRIFAATDPQAGLKYLEDGAREAHRLSDGWFWFANLVEYAELNFRLWHDNRDRTEYVANIAARSAELDQVAEDLAFPDLKGRWKLLQAHLAVHDYLEGRGDASTLDGALDLYETGFVNLGARHVASSGTASLKGEFATFRSVLSQLPAGVQAMWQARLRSAWAAADSMVLLARLEELFRPAG